MRCGVFKSVEFECTRCRVLWEEDVLVEPTGEYMVNDDIVCPICKNDDLLLRVGVVE